MVCRILLVLFIYKCTYVYIVIVGFPQVPNDPRSWETGNLSAKLHGLMKLEF